MVNVRYEMNRCYERENDRVYNEDLGEKVISFFCLVIAFFENKIVDAVCRIIGMIAVCVSIFFYASAVMTGSVGFFGTVLFGALIISVSAFMFRSKSARN